MCLDLDFSLKDKRKYLLLLIFYLFVIYSLSAQKETNSPHNDLDGRYTPAESIFSNTKNSPKSNKSLFDATDISYGIKFMPVELVRGNLVFENEINISNSSNITCAIGYNILESYLAKSNLSLFYDIPLNTLSAYEAMSTGAYQNGGAFFSIGFKSYAEDFWDLSFFFNDGDPFNGLYAFLRYERYASNYFVAPIIDNIPVSGSRAFKIVNNHLNYGIGFSAVKDGKVKTIHDFYLGAGVKIFSYTNFKKESIYNSNAGTTGPVYTTEYRNAGKSTGVDFSFTFGYSIGFGF
jgi:hypothetical protein